MDVTLATHRAPRSLAESSLVRGLLASAAATGTLVLLLLGVLMLARRWAGAFDHPLGAAHLFGAALSLAACCQFLHLLWRRLALPRLLAQAAAGLVMLAFFTTALALSLPGSPQAPLALLWALLVAGEGTALLAAGREPHGPGNARQLPRIAAPRSPARPLVDAAAADWQEGLLPPGATQRMTRSLDAEVGEVIHGSLRETFPPGGRTANVHVAFCPPLAATPELACEQIAGPETAIKVGELQPYGARFDLRLKRASSEPVEVVLEFSAIAPPPAE